MTAYYNEPDPVAAEWLRRLIAAGHIAPGEVDERDIRDVSPAELVRFTQCHFFAGIGIWSLALRQAGWDDDRPVWTGSCPCQPFSTAGAGEGFADERHLWPHWHWLIEQGRPGVILGEQVASKDGLGWHDLVSDDLDGIGYASGAVVISAAGFGVDWRGSAESQRLERALRLCGDPMVARHLAAFADWADQSLGFGGFHIRERQYFVGLADAEGGGCGVGGDASLARPGGHADGGGDPSGRLVDAERAGLEGLGRDGDRGNEPGRVDAQSHGSAPASGAVDRVGLSERERRDRGGSAGSEIGSRSGRPEAAGRSAPAERLADRDRSGRGQLGPDGLRDAEPQDDDGRREPLGLADPDGGDAGARDEQRGRIDGQRAADRGAARRRDGGGGDLGPADRAGQADERRGAADWLLCRDGYWRPARPGSFPLAHAVAGRVGQLRAYGNGLDLETATAFCRAVREIIEERAG